MAPPIEQVCFDEPADQVAPSTEPYNQWLAPDGALATSFYRSGNLYRIRFPAICDYLYDRNQQTIRCIPVPGIPEATCRHLYANQVRPLIESDLGRLVVHASGVVIDGRAILFIGRSGSGKSTIAADFALHGAQHLSDDGIAIEAAGDILYAIGGTQGLRLWGDSFQALISPATALAADKVKHVIEYPPGITPSTRAVPIGALIFLGDKPVDGPAVTRLPPMDAFWECFRNLFILQETDRDVTRAHLSVLGRLVAGVTAMRIDYPRDYRALATVRDYISEAVANDP